MSGRLPAALDAAGPKGGQLRAILTDVIAASRPGDALPSERALAERYGIARGTVRAELDRLVTTGAAERVHGRGTFVAQPRVAQAARYSSFTEDMRARGLEPGSRVLRQEVVDAPPEVAAALDVAAGAPVVVVERLRTAVPAAGSARAGAGVVPAGSGVALDDAASAGGGVASDGAASAGVAPAGGGVALDDSASAGSGVASDGAASAGGDRAVGDAASAGSGRAVGDAASTRGDRAVGDAASAGGGVASDGAVSAGGGVALDGSVSAGGGVAVGDREARPMAIELVWLPAARFGALVDADLAAGSLLEALADGWGVGVLAARQQVVAVLVDAREAELLAVVPGAPALRFTTVADDGERPVYRATSLFRADRYEISLHQHR